MITRLDEAVAVLKSLPDDDQERVVTAVLAFADDRSCEMPIDDEAAERDFSVLNSERD